MQKLQAAARLICRSRRPLILAGAGILSGGVQRRMRRVAVLADVPVVATPGAAAGLGSTHSLLIGHTGPPVSDRVVQALARADVVVILGMSDEADREVEALFGAGAAVIRIGPPHPPAQASRRAAVELQGELKYLLVCLEDLLLPVRHPLWKQEFVAGRCVRDERSGSRHLATI